ncbi:MAG TPA: 50S ribosomal protein L11 methyltransferase [Sedimentibacter sp.]|nr:50S ribosomal protein L11 methyltransferase [Sedimentibacter sp.]HPX00286.1 50S ribosomal protein L11 methyltransferase [Sedimentibacter sp.]HQB63716.1 50S ribosomal protein L11 methyltransferase [Sedimentibacter sp.]
MNWTEVSIYTTTNGLEIINGALMKLNINDAVIEDANVFDVFLNDKTQNWDYIDENLAKMKDIESCIKVYLADNDQGRELLRKIYKFVEEIKEDNMNIDLGSLRTEIKILNDEDWANNWKQYFKPFVVGDKIVIKPSWEDYREPAEDKIILEIDPGMSFGTGQHHTTRLCIEQIIKHIHKDMEVLDMGCGSGILSIAALLLGAKSCTGVDIDENAVRIAKENAELNNIYADKFTVYCGDVTEDNALREKIGYNKYDMIAVNIIAQIIMGMSETFLKFLKKGGLVIASGIIEKYLPDVMDNFESLGFKILEVNHSEEWVSITARHDEGTGVLS